mgnify:CR=1 FL=1|tara:strand:- start:247 stop:465 length:219 start_codon:yes stop_codon:yes gene_type:complete
MPSLDGYSLNEKMDRLIEDVQSQITQLKIDFQNLYTAIERIKKEKEDGLQKSNAKKGSTKKAKKESVEHAKA